jgi:hypothetical protein
MAGNNNRTPPIPKGWKEIVDSNPTDWREIRDRGLIEAGLMDQGPQQMDQRHGAGTPQMVDTQGVTSDSLAALVDHFGGGKPSAKTPSRDGERIAAAKENARKTAIGQKAAAKQRAAAAAAENDARLEAVRIALVASMRAAREAQGGTDESQPTGATWEELERARIAQRTRDDATKAATLAGRC